MLLLAYLRDRDVSCPVCKYNLRSLTFPRCPECGAMLELRVSPAEPRLGLWLLLVVPLLLASGLGLLVIYAIIRVGPPPSSDWPVAICFLATVPLATLALLTRRRFMRASASTRKLLAICSFVTMFLLFGFLFLKIR